MPTAKGNPEQVDIGVGRLWLHEYVVGDLATYLPTAINATEEIDPTETPDVAGWEAAGYTEEGSTITYETSSEGIEVAEEIDRIAVFRTAATGKVAFAFAEATARNLTAALNGGLTAAATISPLAQADEKRISIVFDADNGARWVFPKCYNTASFELKNQKAPAKRSIAVEFELELAPSQAIMSAIPNGDGLI